MTVCPLSFDNVKIPISLTNPLHKGTVKWKIYDGKIGTNYTTAGGEIDLPADDLHIDLGIINDPSIDLTKCQIALYDSSNSFVDIGQNNRLELIIDNKIPVVEFERPELRVQQTSKSLSIPVVRSGKAVAPCTFAWTVVSGYDATKVDSGEITLPKGELSTIVNLHLTSDVLDDDETEIGVQITPIDRCTVNPHKDKANIQVTNDLTGGLFGFEDKSPITLLQSQQKEADFKIDRTINLKGKVKVGIELTANNDSAYYGQELDTEKFRPGESDSTVEVKIPQKIFKEEEDTFTLRLLRPSNGGEIDVNRETLVVKVINDLGEGTVNIGESRIECKQSVRHIKIPVTRLNRTGSKCDCKFKITGDTGILESDDDGKLKFSAYEKDEHINIELEAEPQDEDVSKLYVKLVDPDDCIIGNDVCEIIIENDVSKSILRWKDDSPRIIRQSEGKKAKFIIERYSSLVGKMKVDYEFRCPDGSPYSSLRGDDESFRSKEDESSFTIDISQDNHEEEYHEFEIFLHSATNGGSIDENRSVLTVRIINDFGPGLIEFEQDEYQSRQTDKEFSIPLPRTIRYGGSSKIKYRIHDGDDIIESGHKSGEILLGAGMTAAAISLAWKLKPSKQDKHRIKVELFDPENIKFGRQFTHIDIESDLTDGLFGFRDQSPIILHQSDQKTAKFKIDRTDCLDGKVKVPVELEADSSSYYHGEDLETETFKSGEDDSTVEVKIPQKEMKDLEDTFTLVLQNPSKGGSLIPEKSKLVVIIKNDIGDGEVGFTSTHYYFKQSDKSGKIPVIKHNRLASKCDLKFKIDDMPAILKSDDDGKLKYDKHDREEFIDLDFSQKHFAGGKTIFKIRLRDEDDCKIREGEGVATVEIEHDIGKLSTILVKK